MRRAAARLTFALMVGAIPAAAGPAAHAQYNQPTTTAVLRFDPPEISFPSTRVGEASAPRKFTASGSQQSQQSRLEGRGAAHFTITASSCAPDSPGYPSYYQLSSTYSCTVTVVFQPTEPGSWNADLVMVSGNTRYTSRLLGTATPAATAAVTLRPDSLAFGEVEMGTTGGQKAVTVENTGTSSLSLSIESSSGEFVADGTRCDGPLAVGRSCEIRVSFTPVGTGDRTARLRVGARATSLNAEAGLHGTGVAPPAGVTVSPERILFGEAQVGTTAASRSIRVVNIGRRPVEMGEPARRGDTDFRTVGGSCGRGTPLEPQASCDVLVAFTPASEGARSARLSLPFSGGVDAKVVELSGRGTARPTDVVPPPTTVPPDLPPGAGPTLDVAPGQARPGARATVRGSGYRGETKLYWNLRADDRLLASLTPDHRGHIATALTLPSDGGAGQHRIFACDEIGCGEAAVVLVSASGGLPAWALALAAILLAVTAGGGASTLVRRGRGGGNGGDDGGVRDGGLRPGEREVRTGFSSADDPMRAIDETRPLAAGAPYHFWLELGPARGGSGARPVRLDTVLFGYEGEFEIQSSQGQLELADDGSAGVVRQGGMHAVGRGKGASAGRLVFPVHAPSVPGTHRIRCSLYHRQVLVQSWVISATVEGRYRRLWRRRGPAVTRARDYVLARSLEPAHLDRLAPHQLSAMLNDNGDGAHSFRLFGEGGFESSVRIGPTVIGELTRELRRELEEVACELVPGRPPRYRYDGPLDVERLGRDLIRLARFGFRSHAALVGELGKDAPGAERSARRRLAALLRAPGRIQVANIEDGTDVVPAAFLYDHPLDSARTLLRLCPAFQEALHGKEPLEASACFGGACPSYGDNTVVCPSGFWGYRHVIGVPQSVGNDRTPLDVPLEVGPGADRAIPAGLSTDPGFTHLPAHVDALRRVDPARPWDFFDSRDPLLHELSQRNPALVYFYCHGGTDAASAYIQVGPLTEDLITGDVFPGYEIEWDSHPLVFVNGCNTAAVGPETPLELVAGLVKNAFAAGVIGTQVTVFEPLACAFAETFLRALLRHGRTVGAAIQTTRLALLKQGNPLGLVYTPFVADDMRILPTTASAPAGLQRQHA